MSDIEDLIHSPIDVTVERVVTAASESCGGCRFRRGAGCRRRPPVVVARFDDGRYGGWDAMSFWPEIDEERGWCGEFEPAGAPEATS